MLTEDIENLSAYMSCNNYRWNGCEIFGSFNVMQPEELTAEITTVEFDEWNDIDLDLLIEKTAPIIHGILEMTPKIF